MRLVWDERAWEDYLWWQVQDRKVLRRINLLIQDIARNGNEGIGKPEPLKHAFQGYWSRRITEEHRLVYKVVDDDIRAEGVCQERADTLSSLELRPLLRRVRLAACRYHYDG